MNFESWRELYRPRVNPRGLAFGIDGSNFMFETFGRDLDRVERALQADASAIWTIVETEFGNVLIEGFHHVNRVGYLIATVPHSGAPVEVRFEDLQDE